MLSARDKVLVTVLVLLVVLFIGVRLLVGPGLDRLTADRAALAQLQTEQDLTAAKLAQAAGQEKSRKKALDAADRAAAALLPTLDNSELTRWFGRMASQNHLNMTSVSFSDAAPMDIRSLTAASAPQAAAANSGQFASDEDLKYQLRSYVETYRGTSSATRAASGASAGSSAGSSSRASASGSGGRYPAALLEKTVSLRISGSAADIGRFLTGLTHSGRAVRVTSYSGVSQGGGTAAVIVQCFGAVKPGGADRLTSGK